MQKLLLQCTSLDEAQQIKSFLETRLPYEIHLSFGPNETENILSNKAIQLLIWDTQSFGAEESQFLRSLRSLGFVFPILVLSKDSDESEQLLAAQKNKVYFLQRPLEFKALKGVTRKLMIQKAIPQQRFRRFNTNQKAQIETYLSAETLESSMYNLSLGGAYVEFSEKPEISVGDMVRLQVPLKDLERFHHMNAKVIWTTRKGAHSGGYGVGMKFVKDKDVYSQILEKM